MPIRIFGPGAARRSKRTARPWCSTPRTTVDSVEVRRWPSGRSAYDEGGLAWDDSSNNRAFLAGTISATLNGASIYLVAKRKPDNYLPKRASRCSRTCLHAPLPKGAAGQFGYHLPMSNMLMELFEEPESGEGVPALDHLEGGLSEVVQLAAGLLRRGDHDLGEGPALEEGPGDVAVPDGRARRALPRLRRAGGPQSGRGAEQVHHHRHVRQGDAGHVGRGRGEMGARGGRQRSISPDVAWRSGAIRSLSVGSGAAARQPQWFRHRFGGSSNGRRLTRWLQSLTVAACRGAGRSRGSSRTSAGSRSFCWLPTVVLLGLFIAYPFVRGRGAVGDRH